MREPPSEENVPVPVLAENPIYLVFEELIPISEVPKHLPKKPGGKRVHISAVYRWMSRGVRGVRLEYTFVGGVRYTSAEALQRFADRLSAAHRSESRPPTPRRRQMQMEAAAREAQRILDHR